MFNKFYPKEYVDSAYEIDYAKLYEQGIRGLLFDVDNTLAQHGAPADTKAIEFFELLRNIGFATCLISNNKEDRVKPFADAVHSDYIYKANKPFKAQYIQAVYKMKTSIQTTCFVGDQLFTDVFGANKVGLYTFLVKPIHPSEEIQIVLKRKLEKIVLYFYLKKRNRG